MLVLAVAAGLVGMHHPLLADDAAAPAGATAASGAPTVTPGSVIAPGLSRKATTGAASAAAAPGEGMVAVGAGHDAVMSMLMHPCLAVLTGFILLGLTTGAIAVPVRRPRPAVLPLAGESWSGRGRHRVPRCGSLDSVGFGTDQPDASALA